jgi:mono/diheme cytochrome c family protein
MQLEEITMLRILAGPAILIFLVSAQAQENVPLKPGTGVEAVEANCGACHSLDYPRINAPFLKRQGWETVVNKMINAFGAPIAKDDVEVIATYLAQNYGKSPAR